MKKILFLIITIFYILPLSTLIGAHMAPTTHAQVGIDCNLIPDDDPFKKVICDLNEKAENPNEDAAVLGTNTILLFFANGLIFVAAPLAVMFLAHGGQAYVFAFGDPPKLEMAKREITWALLGLGTILVSYIAIQMLVGAFLKVDTKLPEAPAAEVEKSTA